MKELHEVRESEKKREREDPMEKLYEERDY